MLFERQPTANPHRGSAAGPCLGTVTFGATADTSDRAGALTVRVPLEILRFPENERGYVDVWHATAAVERHRFDDVQLATDGVFLLGCIEVDERATAGLRAAAERAYRAIFAALDRSACGHPLRFWNYVPRINDLIDGLERYRHFNIGRQEAFIGAQRTAFEGAPAACAIGSAAETLQVWFVAARDAPVAIENPRQVSAYHYPAEYGPRAPTFSRATLATHRTLTLFISGTASIIGHRSQHAADPVAQTGETFVNLRAVIESANAKSQRRPFALDTLAYTVYLRDPAHLAAVHARFVQEVGERSFAAQNAVFLRADICRADLLVEIEASASLD